MPPVPDPRLALFGQVVRAQRRLKNLTQEDVGRGGKLGATHVTRVERASKDVQMTTLFRVVDGLGITFEQLGAALDEAIADAAATAGERRVGDSR
jgi:transcriptional regulator with XRE-family HTH domain